MDFSSLDINASGLTAQRLRMDTIAGNLANVNTTRKADGSIGAYKRKQVVFAPILNKVTGENADFGMASNYSTGIKINGNGNFQISGGISNNDNNLSQGVEIKEIVEDNSSPTNMVYNPGHPDADANGYVEMPNVNVVNEMVDMISATRAYEANLSAVNNFKSMFKSTLQM